MISTDRIEFSNAPCASIAYACNTVQLYTGIGTIKIATNSLEIHSENGSGYAQLSSNTYLQDAAGKTIIQGGIWQITESGGSGSLNDTGRITGGTAHNGNDTATGQARATGGNSVATGYNANAKGFNSTATGVNSLTSDTYATATGYAAIASGNSSTATGYNTKASGVGSFAYGTSAKADKAGEGVLRVATYSVEQDDYATSLKLVGAGSCTSNTTLSGMCGLGYKEKTADWRYVKLKDIFDLADKASELLAPGSVGNDPHNRDCLSINVNWLDIKANEIRIANREDNGAAQLSNTANLTDASGTILIQDGVWQLQGGGEVANNNEIVIGPDPDSNSNIVSIELDGSHFGQFDVTSISLLARNTQTLPTTSPVYLSIWKQVSGDNYSLLAVSKEPKTQVWGEWTKWEFDKVELTGARIRIAALATPETPFANASQIGVQCQARGADDTCLLHGASNPINYHPAMIIRSEDSAKYAPLAHVSDEDKHLRTGERDKWDEASTTASSAKSIAENAQSTASTAQQTANSAANNAQAAINNTTTLATSLAQEKNDALQHLYWHHAGNNTALAALMGPGGDAYFPEAKHVTDAEKAAWSAAAEDAAAAKTDAAAAKTAAEEAKTAAEEAKNAAESGGGTPGPQGPQGEPGATGPAGPAGPAGQDGESAYQIAVRNGYQGDESSWLASLKGDKGDPGDSGGGAGFEDTGKITGGTATDNTSTAIGGNSQAAEQSTATGRNAQATGVATTATGYDAQAGDCYSTATGSEAKATATAATATGFSAVAAGLGSFAYGACAKANNEGEGVLRVGGGEATATEFVLIQQRCQISIDNLDGEAGLAYSVGEGARVYKKFSELFGENDCGSGNDCGSAGFEDTGHILGGTATSESATATGHRANAAGDSATATGYEAQASDCCSTAIGSQAKANAAFTTATGSMAEATAPYATATGHMAQATVVEATATGFLARATATGATATGSWTEASGVGSFAYGAYATTSNAGEGVLRVSTTGDCSFSTSTELKLVGAGSEVSTESLGGACGLGYKEKTAEYRYTKLKDIFDLADKAEDVLSFGDSLKEHVENTDMHITAEDRKKWNAAAENSGGGGFEDTGKITGGNKEAEFGNNTGVAVGSGSNAISNYTTAVGENAKTTVSSGTAVGYNARVTGVGSFALGVEAKASEAGVGVLRVLAGDNYGTYAETTATTLKLVGAGSDTSTAALDGMCGLGYKEKTADYRYAKLKDLFDLADNATSILAGAKLVVVDSEAALPPAEEQLPGTLYCIPEQA